jgi:hypothetical protein
MELHFVISQFFGRSISAGLKMRGFKQNSLLAGKGRTPGPPINYISNSIPSRAVPAFTIGPVSPFFSE